MYLLMSFLIGEAFVQSSAEGRRSTVWSAVKLLWLSSWTLPTIHPSCFVCMVWKADGGWRYHWTEESRFEREKVINFKRGYHYKPSWLFLQRTALVMQVVALTIENFFLAYGTWWFIILFSRGQEFLATESEVWVRFPSLSAFLWSSGSGTGPTQPREYKK
jgi:hypothetical protein